MNINVHIFSLFPHLQLTDLFSLTFLPVTQFKSCPTTHLYRRRGERMYCSYSFTTSALDGVSGQHHARPRFTPGERTPGTHCTRGWVGPRAGLDTEARGKILSPLPGIEHRSSRRQVHSQTQYWLSYPEHNAKYNVRQTMWFSHRGFFVLGAIDPYNWYTVVENTC
jgi:hypothetical protein